MFLKALAVCFQPKLDNKPNNIYTLLCEAEKKSISLQK